MNKEGLSRQYQAILGKIGTGSLTEGSRLGQKVTVRANKVN